MHALEQLRLARERGYIVTLAGRRWPIGGLASLDPHDLSYAERLARRWFRDLRWYGRSDATPGEVALSWLTIDTGALVRVRFARGMAVLEVELGPGEQLDR
ncbi:MAG: hypothetical protein ABR607_17545, partial [Pyrinomonadaceae bacterium]